METVQETTRGKKKVKKKKQGLFRRRKKKLTGASNGKGDVIAPVSSDAPATTTRQRRQLAPSTRMLHEDDDIESCPDVAPPLHMSSTFVTGNPERVIYSRHQQPARARLERLLGALAGGMAVTYSSGLSAIMAAVALFRPRRVVTVINYHGSRTVLQRYAALAGPDFQLVELPIDEHAMPPQPGEDEDGEGESDGKQGKGNGETREDDQTDDKGNDEPSVDSIQDGGDDAVECKETAAAAASDSDVTSLTLQQGDVVIIETPSNPRNFVVDIEAWAQAVHVARAHLIVDATFASPALIRPLDLGVDIVVSMLAHRLASERTSWGSVPGAMETWLLMRSLRTFPLRLKRQSKSAYALAMWLEQECSDVIQRVWSTCLPSHPSHELWRRLAGDKARNRAPPCFGFVLRSEVHARNLASRTKLFVDCTSLGGVESNLDWRARWDSHVHPALVRVSVGLEDVTDLQWDLRAAFDDLLSMYPIPSEE